MIPIEHEPEPAPPAQRVNAVDDAFRAEHERTQKLLSIQQGLLRTIAERREKGELSPYDFDPNAIFQFSRSRIPIARQDLNHSTGPQVIILTKEQIEELGGLDILRSTGETDIIEPEQVPDGGQLILFPEDLG